MNRLITTMALMAVSCACALSALACGASLTPQDQQQITQDTSQIAACQAKGLACQNDDAGHDCYTAYDSCMKDGGL